MPLGWHSHVTHRKSEEPGAVLTGRGSAVVTVGTVGRAVALVGFAFLEP
jgi:hypothetical protein